MKKLIPIILCMMAFASCKKDYLDTVPTDRVSAASAFNTTEDALLVLNGVHRATYVRETQGNYGEPSMMIYRDMMGEDLVMNAVGNGWYNNEYKWLSHRNENSGLVDYAYRFYYRIIANVNLIIANIDNASGPAADKNFIKGNALAYRAWAYFNLVQLFAKRYDKATAPNSQLGVPLLLAPISDGLPRETVENVYKQVNTDIDAAIGLLKTTRPNKSHININVAQGIKARIALTQQNWAAAATAAIAARAGYPLMSQAQYQDGFSSYSNPEWIWGITHIDDQSGYFGAFHSYLSSNYNSTNIRTNPKSINKLIYDMLPDTDVRTKMWDKTGSAAALTPPGGIRRPYMTQKFRLPGGTTVSTITQGDVVYMRSAEMYLIEAEAKARNNDEVGARQALYTLVVARDPSYTLSTRSGQALIDEIMLHRRIELWGEGFRWLDLKRLNLPLNRNGSNHQLSLANIFDMPAGDNAWQFLIPRDELNANKQAVQNPL